MVNTAVNRSIAPKPDLSVTRKWRDDATQGDCKDYAMAKRSQLLDRGWPVSALLIAVAQIPSDEMHAVLIVLTDKGELVLDNLRYGITPWKALPYRSHKMMSPENPLFWRRILSRLRGHPEAAFMN